MEASAVPSPVVPSSRWRIARWWMTAAIVYWVVLFTATHVPTVEVIPGGMNLDKLIHASAYFVLTTLLLITARRRGMQTGTAFRLVLAVVALSYGALDEITQPFVGRACELADWLADLSGVVTAIGIDVWRKRK